MLNKQDIDLIKKEVEVFFDKIPFEVGVEFLPETDSTLRINLKLEEPQILIGENGQTLAEIQHILKSILRKKIKESFYLDVDINGYKKKKADYLKELAKETADQVALTKKEKALSPMSAYERRIIHMELAEREDIESESTGEAVDRRVVIKPKP